MTAERKKLAKRFVKCERWRWMPGMLSDQDRRCIAVDGRWVFWADEYGQESGEALNELPDLSDPATLGCILALVRDATGDRRIHCRVRANVYRVYSGVSPVGRWLESEAEALLLALEAA